MSLDVKPQNLAALLLGISKRKFFGAEDITQEYLVTELLGECSLSNEEKINVIEECETLLGMAAYQRADIAAVERMAGNLDFVSKEQCSIFAAFWRKEKDKIHEQLHRQSSAGAHLESVQWRVDVPTDSRQGGGLGKPTAIVKLNLSPSPTQPGQFKSNAESIATMLRSFEHIEQRLAART